MHKDFDTIIANIGFAPKHETAAQLSAFELELLGLEDLTSLLYVLVACDAPQKALDMLLHVWQRATEDGKKICPAKIRTRLEALHLRLELMGFAPMSPPKDVDLNLPSHIAPLPPTWSSEVAWVRAYRQYDGIDIAYPITITKYDTVAHTLCTNNIFVLFAYFITHPQLVWHFFKNASLLCVRVALKKNGKRTALHECQKAFGGLLRKDLPLQLTFEDRCPSCGKATAFIPQGELIPMPDAPKDAHDVLVTGSWLCPHCLAHREWDRVVARQALWEIYNTWFAALPRTKGNAIPAHLLERAEHIAIALRPWGFIRFGNFTPSFYGALVLSTTGFIVLNQISISEPASDIMSIMYSKKPIVNTTVWNICTRQLHTPLIYNEKTENTMPLEHRLIFLDEYLSLYLYFPCPVIFTKQEENLALDELKRMNIPAQAPYVCLHVRSPLCKQGEPDNSGESERIHGHRNADVESYALAVKRLVDAGYYVIRMGAEQNLPPLSFESDKVIDYARNYRTEFMDLWLFMRCNMILTTGSGVDISGILSNRPFLVTNYNFLFALSLSTNFSLALCRHMKLIAEGRLLPHRERIQKGLGAVNDFVLVEEGVTLIPNTPEEIDAVVVEMLEYLQGTRLVTEHDIELQKRFWKPLDEFDLNSVPEKYRKCGEGYPRMLTSMGRDYLRDLEAKGLL